MLSSNNSLKKRYSIKLLANVVSVFASAIVMLFIPRALGPAAYGNFKFLTQYFEKVINFFNLGADTAFFTKLSQNNNEKKLIGFYSIIALLILLCLFGFVFIIDILGLADIFWPDQKMKYVYLALLFSVLIWLSNTAFNIMDAFALTLYSEILRILQKIILVILIPILFLLATLNITNYFYLNIGLFMALIIVLFTQIRHKILLKDVQWQINKTDFKKYIASFYIYCNPLFLHSLAAFSIGIIELWLLQRFAGSKQFGYYGLSFQIGVVCFMFTTAMTPLLIREFAKSFKEEDYLRMRLLFTKFLPIFYTISSYFAIFVMIQAENVTKIFGGGQFKDAVIAVVLMSFYSIHRTYGQLSGSIFISTDRTKLFRNIGVFYMFIGLILTYLLVAPKHLGGISLGAIGLSIKMVVINVLLTNTQLIYNAKFLSVKYLPFLIHQILVVTLFSIIAFLATALVNTVSTAPFFIFIISGIIYSLIISVTIYMNPSIIKMNKKEIKGFIKLGKNFIKL